MGQVITVAIAGQGRSGYAIHANYLRNDARFKIVAVADELPERRQQAIDEFGCEAFCNYQELLDKGPAVDLFINATPSRFHVETSMAAMKSGKIKYLVTEKPTATSADSNKARISPYTSGKAGAASTSSLGYARMFSST